MKISWVLCIAFICVSMLQASDQNKKESHQKAEKTQEQLIQEHIAKAILADKAATERYRAQKNTDSNSTGTGGSPEKTGDINNIPDTKKPE